MPKKFQDLVSMNISGEHMYGDLEDTGSQMVVAGGDIKLRGVQFIDTGALLHDLELNVLATTQGARLTCC